MIDSMMNGSVGMMLVMGLFCLLAATLLILAAAALVKYLFFNNQGTKHEDSSDVKHGL